MDVNDCMSGANYEAVWFKSEPQIGRGAKRRSGGIREESTGVRIILSSEKNLPVCSFMFPL